MGIKYVFWDSDNTLVDTKAHHWNKHLRTLARHNITLGEEWQERIYTNNGSQNWDWLSAELGLTVPRDQYLDEIDAWYHAHIGEIGIRAGVLDALDLFASQGIPMGVVSNGRRRSVVPALDAKGLAKRFNFILCIEDYQGRKPDPAPYLAAKTRMGQAFQTAIDPSDCLVIEDDPKGVAAGRAAGMHVIDRPVATSGDDDAAGFITACRAYLN